MHLTMLICWCQAHIGPVDGLGLSGNIPLLDDICHQASASLTMMQYRQVSNIRRTLEGNKIVDHSDVVGASPVGAAPTTSSFST